MRDFALAPEIEELRQAAERLATTQLATAVRDHETAGRWPDDVCAVLDGFPLGGLDLPESHGGVGAGCIAKAVLLETIAMSDAAGLYAADRPGSTVGAVLGCPDRGLVDTVLDSCREDAQAVLVVADPDFAEIASADIVPWAPGWPALRWVWVMERDTLRLHEVTATPEPVISLAFQASGGVSTALADTTLRGSWDLGPHRGLAVRGRARLWGAAIAVGIAQAAIEETIEYTMDRVVFGKPVAHHQGNAFDIAAAAARVHAARLVVRDAAGAFDRDEPDAGYWATQAWLETMEAAFDATNLGIQLLGGHGFIVDHLAEKRFREARMLAMAVGARDFAEFDVAAHTLDVPDPFVPATPLTAATSTGASS